MYKVNKKGMSRINWGKNSNMYIFFTYTFVEINSFKTKSKFYEKY